ncbi:hypothetical protein [Novosphingobium sp.]|uniref:hypothetical protein n=1 Tax=Novosphingobium sp. TaxID=1874826 RepID=UPI0035AFBB15
MPTKPATTSAKQPKAASSQRPKGPSETELSEQLAERFAEVATLTRLLAEAEQSRQGGDWRFEWLCKVAPLMRSHMLARGRFGLAAPSDERLMSQLRDAKLFDPDAYLASNPDVRDAGVDALQHFLSHGLAEGRSLGV